MMDGYPPPFLPTSYGLIDGEQRRFIPTNPCLRGVLSLFLDEKSADVIFEFNGNDGHEKNFYAHRLILQACAPSLFEFCDGAGQDMTSVRITGVKPEIFHHLLYYVYGGTIPDNVFSESAKDIIDAADRLGIGNLKVEAEGWYVKSTPITLDNFVENLYFSDTKKCALLKERVMDFLVQNEAEALEKLSTQQDTPQSESMLTDFLTASARKKRRMDPNDYNFMSIDAMRRKLDAKGVGVDGTREMLICALKKCYGGTLEDLFSVLEPQYCKSEDNDPVGALMDVNVYKSNQENFFNNQFKKYIEDRTSKDEDFLKRFVEFCTGMNYLPYDDKFKIIVEFNFSSPRVGEHPRKYNHFSHYYIAIHALTTYICALQ